MERAVWGQQLFGSRFNHVGVLAGKCNLRQRFLLAQAQVVAKFRTETGRSVGRRERKSHE